MHVCAGILVCVCGYLWSTNINQALYTFRDQGQSSSNNRTLIGQEKKQDLNLSKILSHTHTLTHGIFSSEMEQFRAEDGRSKEPQEHKPTDS